MKKWLQNRFPALHGRASLKLLADEERAVLVLFSRPSRAGLIEAPPPPRYGSSRAAVFPPFTGGPH